MKAFASKGVVKDNVASIGDILVGVRCIMQFRTQTHYNIITINREDVNMVELDGRRSAKAFLFSLVYKMNKLILLHGASRTTLARKRLVRFLPT
ncbi:hypothetical protein D9M68_882970 [compost metagenome]